MKGRYLMWGFFKESTKIGVSVTVLNIWHLLWRIEGYRESFLLFPNVFRFHWLNHVREILNASQIAGRLKCAPKPWAFKLKPFRISL